MDLKKCDMCGSQIQNGRCSCSTWITKEEMAKDRMKAAIDQFHEMQQFTLTGDAPHLGCAVVFFRGDYNDCKKVEKFIYKMKGRPFYKD